MSQNLNLTFYSNKLTLAARFNFLSSFFWEGNYIDYDNKKIKF